MTKAKAAGTLAKGGGKFVKAVVKEVNPLDVLRVYLDFRKTVEVEQTKREHIWAERDKTVAAIEAERKFLLFYFKKRFAERERVLEQFFDLLIEGRAQKDAELIDRSLAGILGVVKDSPLKDFEAFREARGQGRTIEI